MEKGGCGGCRWTFFRHDRLKVIDEALRRGDSLEYCCAGRAIQVAADREHALAPVRVPNPQHRQAAPFVGVVPDKIKELSWQDAWPHLPADESGHFVRTALCARRARRRPGSSTGHSAIFAGTKCPCAGERDFDVVLCLC